MAPSPSVPKERVSAIAAALTSGQQRQLNRFLTTAQLRQQRAGTDVTGLLPQGARISLGPGRQTLAGELARIPVTVTGTQSTSRSLNGHWVLVLVHAHGTWQLVGTDRQ